MKQASLFDIEYAVKSVKPKKRVTSQEKSEQPVDIILVTPVTPVILSGVTKKDQLNQLGHTCHTSHTNIQKNHKIKNTGGNPAFSEEKCDPENVFHSFSHSGVTGVAGATLPESLENFGHTEEKFRCDRCDQNNINKLSKWQGLVTPQVKRKWQCHPGWPEDVRAKLEWFRKLELPGGPFPLRFTVSGHPYDGVRDPELFRWVLLDYFSGSGPGQWVHKYGRPLEDLNIICEMFEYQEQEYGG